MPMRVLFAHWKHAPLPAQPGHARGGVHGSGSLRGHSVVQKKSHTQWHVSPISQPQVCPLPGGYLRHFFRFFLVLQTKVGHSCTSAAATEVSTGARYTAPAAAAARLSNTSRSSRSCSVTQ